MAGCAAKFRVTIKQSLLFRQLRGLIGPTANRNRNRHCTLAPQIEIIRVSQYGQPYADVSCGSYNDSTAATV
jgi:hypothetical protein